jgi:ATP-binding cassette subfamily G (WHITE) protein 2
MASLTSLLFTIIVFFGCAFQGSFIIFFATYYLTTMMGIILAYAIAAIVPTMEAANAVLPTYVTICMFFGGLIIVFDKIPVRKSNV